MAFNPDEYLKTSQGFDPDAYLKKDKPESSASKTALESYGNTATLGYLPQIQAMAEPLTDRAFNAMGLGNAEPAPLAQAASVGPEYIAARDANITRQQKQSKENPGASAAGTGAGILASLLVPGGPMAKGASTLEKATRGAIGGAVIGGLANPGDVEGQHDLLQVKDRSKNAAIGGVLGGTLAAAVDKAAPLFKNITEYFSDKAGEKAIGAVGAAKKHYNKLGEEGAKNLGKTALDNDLVGALSTPESILKNASKLKEKAGEEIGDLITSADSAGVAKIDGKALSEMILKDPEIVAAAKTPGMTALVNAAKRDAELLAQNGEMGIKQAHELRKNIDKAINFNKRRVDLGPGEQEVLYKIRDSINNAMNSKIDEIAGLPGADQLKKANKAYSDLSRLEEIAENRVGMNASNRTFGLTDTIAAGAGLASGATTAGRLAGAAAAGLANKVGRTFGKGTQAVLFNKGASVFSNGPAVTAFAKNNPALFQVLERSMAGADFTKPENEITNNPRLMQIFIDDQNLINNLKDLKMREAVRNKVQSLVKEKPSTALERKAASQ